MFMVAHYISVLIVRKLLGVIVVLPEETTALASVN